MKQISDNVKSILGLLVVILGLSYFFMCSIRNIKPDPQILIAMVGAVSTVLGYFFGASSKTNQPDGSTVNSADTVNIGKKD